MLQPLTTAFAAPAGTAGADGPVCDDRTALAAIDVILRRQDELTEILCTVATRTAAADEIRRCIATLAGARWEVERSRPDRIRSLAVFLPSNNILYSYVLFGIVPLLFTDRVLLRPSGRVLAASQDIHRILAADLADAGHLPIEFLPVSQRSFLMRCASAQAVVFNGRADNALAVGARVGDRSLFLAFGSGPNPVVVGPDSDVAQVTRELVSVRFYNSGQDCLCPDVVFVHDSVADDLVDALRPALAGLNVGRRDEPGVQVAPLVYADAAAQAGEFLAAHRGQIVHGGHAVAETGFVEPTLIDRPWSDTFSPPEFFAPVLCLSRYDRPEQIVRWLHRPEEADRGMYLSVYGEPALARRQIATSVVLDGRTTLDAEDGNQPLGGYGTQASHVRRGGTVVGRPLLLSAELGV